MFLWSWYMPSFPQRGKSSPFGRAAPISVRPSVSARPPMAERWSLLSPQRGRSACLRSTPSTSPERSSAVGDGSSPRPLHARLKTIIVLAAACARSAWDTHWSPQLQPNVAVRASSDVIGSVVPAVTNGRLRFMCAPDPQWWYGDQPRLPKPFAFGRCGMIHYMARRARGETHSGLFQAIAANEMREARPLETRSDRASPPSTKRASSG